MLTQLTRFVSQYRLSDGLFAIMFLIFALGLVWPRHSRAWSSRLLFLAFVAIALVATLASAWANFAVWKSPDCAICHRFLPPISNYYFNQVIVRTISTFAFHAAVGLLGGIAFAVFARLTRGRIIDQLDVDLLTVGGMVAGWPNILIFYGLTFAVTVLTTVVQAALERSAAVRMIITPVLPFAAAAVAVFGDQLSRFLGLYNIGLTLR